MFLVPLELYEYISQRIQQNNIDMVKHIILWTLNPELSESEKEAVKAGIKEGLEGLAEGWICGT